MKTIKMFELLLENFRVEYESYMSSDAVGLSVVLPKDYFLFELYPLCGSMDETGECRSTYNQKKQLVAGFKKNVTAIKEELKFHINRQPAVNAIEFLQFHYERYKSKNIKGDGFLYFIEEELEDFIDINVNRRRILSIWVQYELTKCFDLGMRQDEPKPEVKSKKVKRLMSPPKKFYEYLRAPFEEDNKKIAQFLINTYKNKKGKTIALVIMVLQNIKLIVFGTRTELFRSLTWEFGPIGSIEGFNKYFRDKKNIQSNPDYKQIAAQIIYHLSKEKIQF